MTDVAKSPSAALASSLFQFFMYGSVHPIDRSLVTDYMHEFFDSLLTSSVEPSSPTETT